MPDVLVTGAGPTAMLAALDFAEVGLSVEVVLGQADAWPDRAVSDPEGAVAEALARIALPVAPEHPGFAGAEPVSEPRRAPLLRGPGGAWMPQAEPEVLGVPAQPLAREVQRLLGIGGALRVWRDRIAPVLTVGKTQSFGQLVRTRIGANALTRLVAPAVAERYGVPAGALDAAVAAPGLNETLTRAGSLTGAVLAYADRNVARETETRPRAGWAAARAALLERLSLYAVEFSEDLAIAARESGTGWEVERASGAVTRARGLVIDAADLRGWREPGRLGVDTVSAPIRVLDQAGEEHSELPRSEGTRMHAEIDIQDPGLPREAIGDPARGALQQVDLAGAPWAVRFEAVGAEPRAWRARLSGPVEQPAPADGAVLADETLIRGLEAVLEAAGGRSAPGSTWRVAREIAPFATVATRERAEAALTTWDAEESERIAVGAELHGGDLGRALIDARRGSIALRRRLTGIAG